MSDLEQWYTIAAIVAGGIALPVIAVTLTATATNAQEPNVSGTAILGVIEDGREADAWLVSAGADDGVVDESLARAVSETVLPRARTCYRRLAKKSAIDGVVTVSITLAGGRAKRVEVKQTLRRDIDRCAVGALKRGRYPDALNGAFFIMLGFSPSPLEDRESSAFERALGGLGPAAPGVAKRPEAGRGAAGIGLANVPDEPEEEGPLADPGLVTVLMTTRVMTGDIDRRTASRAVRAHRSEIERCFEEPWSRGEVAPGTLNVVIDIGSNGRGRAEPEDDTMAPVSRCLRAAVPAWQFVAGRGEIQLHLSLRFVARGL